MKGRACRLLIACSLVVMVWPMAFSQTPSINAQSSSATTKPAAIDEDSGSVGAAVKVSTLGGGAEVAVRVTHRTNVRAGFNVITYSRGFNKDGISYNGQLDFKTFEAHYDFFRGRRAFISAAGFWSMRPIPSQQRR